MSQEGMSQVDYINGYINDHINDLNKQGDAKQVQKAIFVLMACHCSLSRTQKDKVELVEIADIASE